MMRREIRRWIVFPVAIAIMGARLGVARAAQTASPAPPEDRRMGSVDFPTSAGSAAQARFLQGVAALHSFWYDAAQREFQAALAIEPRFALAWWGVAMTYHRPFLPGSDDIAGQRALAHVTDLSSLTAREKGYIEALRVLYSNGSRLERARAYAVAMRKLHRAYPDDLEAAAFYALSLLGSDWDDDVDLARARSAGVIARDVYRRNPRHPGAAHYIIHSYDEPTLAQQALDAAQHYGEIAPDVPHALHMPSHVYLQLGMWPETSAANEAAWAASERWVQMGTTAAAARDYHNLHWLIYSCLQEGRYAKAAALLAQFRQLRKEMLPESLHFLQKAIAAFVVETRCWDRADELFAETMTAVPGANSPGNRAGRIEFCGAELDSAGVTSGIQPADVPAFIRTLAAAARGASETEPMLRELRARAGDERMPEFWRIRVLEITAVISARSHAFAQAFKSMAEAARIEEDLGRPPGPPAAYKPPHELYGEILLQAGNPAEAESLFQQNLRRHPNRALSLLGCARAQAARGDRQAAFSSYTRLLEIWRHADEQLPELLEARAFLKSHRG